MKDKPIKKPSQEAQAVIQERGEAAQAKDSTMERVRNEQNLNIF